MRLQRHFVLAMLIACGCGESELLEADGHFPDAPTTFTPVAVATPHLDCARSLVTFAQLPSQLQVVGSWVVSENEAPWGGIYAAPRMGGDPVQIANTGTNFNPRLGIAAEDYVWVFHPELGSVARWPWHGSLAVGGPAGGG